MSNWFTTGRVRAPFATAAAAALVLLPHTVWSQSAFQIEEKSISDIQQAIKAGQTTCRQVVEAYLERTKAYNGTCTALVTADGKPVSPAKGAIRAGKPITFPTETVALSTIFPRLEEYKGLPFELGRMEPTLSDPSVQQQWGMRVGIPNAGQLNALETLNIRGERSVTCKGEFDKHPSAGPLPAGAPKACEAFRKLPDALERAAELDAQFGRNPDLAKMPMYCAVFSFKNWYDAKDMRGTGGNDVAFAMDAPRVDSPDIAELRAKGAIIYAVATADNVGGASSRTGPETPKTNMPFGNLKYAQWGGQPCNPYDTTREPRGTSGGSGVSVAANLSTCSICEQGSASCKGPASRNGVVNLLTTKGIIMDGGIGSKKPGDRAGIHCKTVPDAALVLDAIKGFETEDPYTAIPRELIPEKPYASYLVSDADVKNKPLKGVRVGIVREFMVKHVKNDVAISDQIDKEIKTVLRDQLGAELVESSDPMYADDPTVPNLKYTFQDAFSEVMPNLMPEYFWQRTRTGELEFAVPGWDVTSTEYAVALAMRKAPLSPKLTLRRISKGLSNPGGLFTINKYLAERGDAKVKDWATWVANAKFENDEQRAAAVNAVGKQDLRPDPNGISYLKMQSALRMVILKVMYENGIDVFVNPEQTTAPYKLGYAGEPEVNDRSQISCCTAFTALGGMPEMEVPAGFTTISYDSQYELNADKTDYVEVTGTVESKMPPMPVSMMFWAGPGSDAAVIRIGSAYESATHHRKPPPAFGPVTARPATPAPTSAARRDE